MARTVEQLDGCALAFVLADDASATLDAGVEEVLVLSGHPMGAPLPTGALPGLAVDYAREVPSYADHWGGAAPAHGRITVDGRPVVPADLDVTGADRVLVGGDMLGTLPSLLAVLAAGAGLVLVAQPARLDLARLVTTEGVTATTGVQVDGARPLQG